MKLLNNIGKEILNRAIVLERIWLASFLHGRRISARASRL